MIIESNEVDKRIESPLNLLNRLREVTNKPSQSINQIPTIPSAQDLIPDIDDKINSTSTSIKMRAAGIMTDAMDQLKSRIQNTNKPETLARIASEMNKIIEVQEKKELPQDQVNRPQFIIYSPTINQENHYETIEARE